MSRLWLIISTTLALLAIGLVGLISLIRSVPGSGVVLLWVIVGALALALLGALGFAAYLHFSPDKDHLNRVHGEESDDNEETPPAQSPLKRAPVQTAKFAPSPKKRRGWNIFGIVLVAIGVIGVGGEILLWAFATWPLLWSAGTGHQANRISGGPHSPSGAVLDISSEAEVQQIEAEEHPLLAAPLAAGDSDKDPWSSWVQIPTAGVHGFDALLGPAPQTGQTRMQCSSGDTAEDAEARPHESYPCGPHSWFRVNTVQTAAQKVPLDVRYKFLHNS